MATLKLGGREGEEGREEGGGFGFWGVGGKGVPLQKGTPVLGGLGRAWSLPKQDPLSSLNGPVWLCCLVGWGGSAPGSPPPQDCAVQA